ncbi:MAG: sugar kinase [Actinomycetes bacterium]
MTVVDLRGVVACVGEPLVCFSSPPGASLADSLTAEVSEGGAELNVAVHLARLGTPVRFVGAVGDDVLGRRLVARLQREHVDTTRLQVRNGERTGAYVKDWSGERRDVVYLRAGTATSRLSQLPPDALAGVSHLHVSGITASLSEDCLALVDALTGETRSYTVSFDVNHREKLWERGDADALLRGIAQRADLVLVGLDEAQRLWGVTTADDVHDVLPNVPELVVKDDARDATVWSGRDRVTLAPDVVRVVEVVGAGDAFAAGYLYARGNGAPPRVALAAGHRLARNALLATDDLGEPVPAQEMRALLQA